MPLFEMPISELKKYMGRNPCPPSTQFAAYNRITSKKEMVLYPDFGHENLPGMSDTVFEFMRRL